ncbi:hypothetical protein [Staphylococcus pettenkoferi]|uniref:hypothetical protein n=1 Tax=Staphylococcus pettenkoferi TaxID=170573 RepID=UPI002552DD93|nr:hypothetical protein [Staphylococcus pettenkoferi]MDK7284450.1 hypothetical protein [Staphylococcus pettenkoferi]
MQQTLNNNLQKQFDEVENKFQQEFTEEETTPEAGNGGYKAMLKAYMNIEPIAFEVLYNEELEEYEARPQDFHLYDESRVDWDAVLEKLEALQ